MFTHNRGNRFICAFAFMISLVGSSGCDPAENEAIEEAALAVEDVDIVDEQEPAEGPNFADDLDFTADDSQPSAITCNVTKYLCGNGDAAAALAACRALFPTVGYTSGFHPGGCGPLYCCK